MKRFIFLIKLFTIQAVIFAQTLPQTTGDIINLDGGNSEIPQEYIAWDKIVFKPGYHFNAATSGHMIARIDESLVFPVDYTPQNQVVNVDDYQIDQSLPVGAIAGTPAVTQTGAATYTIPIYTPKGTAGMEPKISLVYNSQSGDGIAGLKFNITGISQISRVPKDFYHEGYVENINLDNNDVFALDGNRLIETGGIYHTEVADFSNIYPINNYDHFNVTTKDLKNIEYGNTTDSKFKLNGTTKALAWYINKITDRFGNYMEYSYANSGDEIVLKEIKYMESKNSIKFYYNQKPVDYINNLYFHGTSIRSTKLLKRIKVSSFDKTVRTYEFEYFNDGTFTKLYKIIEYGANHDKINSTIINYGTNDIPFFNDSIISIGDNNAAEYYTGDFNGDGKTDIIKANYTISQDYGRFHTKLELFTRNSLQTNFSSLGSINIPHSQDDFNYTGPRQHPRANPSNDLLGYIPNDFDGDGADDLLEVNMDYDNSQYTVKGYKIYSYKASSLGVIKTINITDSYNRTSYGAKNIYTGDFDGDGKTDIISFLSDGTMYIGKIYLSSNDFQGTLLNQPNPQYWSPTNIIISDKVLIVDFNGNGKQELMVIKGNTTNIFEFGVDDGSGIQYNKIKLIYHEEGSYFPNSTDKIVGIGDFNGDGNSDFLYSFNGTKIYNIAYSMGGGDFHIKQNIYNTTDKPGKFFISDYNGDGRSDICYSYDAGSLPEVYTAFDVLYSRGMSFYTKSYSTTCLLLYSSIFNQSHFFHVGDFNGDGNADILLRFSENTNSTAIFYFNIYKNSTLTNEAWGPQFITKITNGFNQKVKFFYKSLTDNSYYDKCVSNNYLTKCFFQVPIYVVSEIQVDNGTTNNLGQGFNTTYYSYAGAYYQRERKSFQGFVKTTSANYGTNQQITHYYQPYNDDNGKFLALLLAESIVINISSPLPHPSLSFNTKQLYSYNFKFYDNNKRFYPYVSEQHSWDINLNHTVTNYTVNSDDNITNRHTQINGTEKDINVDYQYLYPYFVQNITTTTTYGSKPPFTESVSYTPVNVSGSGGIAVGSETNNQTGITTHYENYNNFGLPEKVRISSAAGETDRFTLTEYDNEGRFITKKTDALGNSEKYVYDNALGVLTKKTDINNKNTLYQYDNWVRPVKVTSPLGIVSQTEYQWYSGTEVPNALYYTKTTTTDAPDVYKYYDKLGRLLRTKTESYGKTILADKQYNSIGQLVSKSDPYISSGTPINTTYEYYPNGDNRLKSTTYQGLTTQYTYGVNQTTITDPAGRSYTQTTDALGNVTESDYPMGSTVSFTYGSHGQPVTISADGINTGMNYNATTGYQTQLADVDAGTTDYGNYSGFGEIKQQTDARGNTYTNDYDDFGRIEDITGSNGDNIHTEYVASGNGIEQIKNITAQNTGKHFNYDEFGRITTKTETIDGTDYNTAYEYDQYGKIKKETYSGGFAVKYEYNNKGELIALRRADNNQVIWYCDNYNKAGKPVTVFLGDNGSSLKTDYLYDNYNYLTDITTGSSFDMHYNWDNTTGNLVSRTDNIKGLTETFTYDDLDRLLTWQSTGNPSFETHYATNGNITYKSDITTGSLDYDPVKVHALAKVNDPLVDFNSTNQEITYTDFNKVETITQDDPDNNVTHQLTFTYGPDHYRRKTVMTDIDMTTGTETIVYTRYYDGNYEKEVTATGTKEYHYISGPAGIIAVYIITNGVGTLYYTLTDHLGSIVALMDENGNIVEETSYGPWGRTRNPNTWRNDNSAGLSLIFRGFTGHEMLPEFGLINMNGRLYDPALGRFLSPDNYVQDPYNPQNYNRYTYALNNPLVYVDPDGEIFWLIPVIIGAVAGFEIGGLQSTGWKEWKPWKWSSESWKAAGIGAMVGAGVGLGGSASASALGANITGIYASGAGLGTTTSAWDVGVNALMTSNINMLSSWAQGRDNTEILLSGVSGLIAGGVGGGIGRNGGRLFAKPGQQAIRTTNKWTSTLSGGLDRLTNSIYNRESVKQTIANTIFGVGEGFYSAYLGNKFAPLKARGITGFAGRYISSAVSQSITSFPGLAISIASYHYSYLSMMSLNNDGPWAMPLSLGGFGLAPPFYGWAINKYLYSSAVVNPLFWLDENL